MPRLRVLAGPSPDCLVPISANSNEAYPIKSDVFDGQVVVHIKGFPDPDGNVLDSEYFHRDDRQNTTWSIQVQGAYNPAFIPSPAFYRAIFRPFLEDVFCR